MACSLSTTSCPVGYSTDCSESGKMAPYDHHTLQTVPYTRVGSPPAASKSSALSMRPVQAGEYNCDGGSDSRAGSYSRSQSSDERGYWTHPRTAPLPPPPPPKPMTGYEDAGIAKAPRSAREPPYPRKHSSPSPPPDINELRSNSGTSSTKSSPGFSQQQQRIVPISGTMSARVYSPPERSRPRHREVEKDTAEKENDPETRTFGKKFKSAFRGAFKRNQHLDRGCKPTRKNTWSDEDDGDEEEDEGKLW